MYSRSVFALTVSYLTLIVAGTPAIAQTAAPSQTVAPPASAVAPAQAPDSGQLQDIVVTARRVSENQQTVPISVTNVTAANLVARGTTTLEAVALGTPNLTIQPSTASKNSAAISIRGQVQTDSVLTVDPSVGVYVDDVYYARAYAVVGDLLDVSGVEILKGPQGTLYGRNTIGGAIKITTNRPDPNGEFSGYLRASYGNYNAVDATGAINIPLIPGKLALRYAGSYHKHDGYTHSYLVPTDPGSGVATSLTPIRDIRTDDSNTFSHRLSLRATPTDNFTFDLSGSIFHADENGIFSVNGPGDIQNYSFGNGTAAVFSNSPQRQANFYSALTDSVPFAVTTVKTVDSTSQLTISDALTAKLILGYVKAENRSSANSDGTVSPGLFFIEFQPELEQNDRQYSAEFQVLGKLLDSKLSYIAGLYYFDEKGAERSPLGETYVFDTQNTTDFQGNAHNKSKSVFGNLIYSLTDQLRVNGGIRYTRDDKSILGFSRSTSPAGAGLCVYAPGPGVVTSITPNGPCSFARGDSFHYVTYEVGTDYRITPDIFLYAKVGNGYRGGGEQIRAISGQSTEAFKPDKVMNYEGGVKSELFDRRLRFNLTYYHTDFSNTQQTLIEVVPNALAQLTTTTVVVNQGSAKIDGIELDSELRLGRQLSIAGGLGYSDFRYANKQLIQPYAPKWTWQIAATYVQPTAIGDVTGRIDYDYRSSSYITGADITTPEGKIAGYGIANARLSVDLTSKLKVSAFVKNLADKEYYRGGIATGYRTAFPAFYGVRGLYVGTPRTFGAEVAVKF